MAMKLNPITGEMEDDGIPEAPGAGALVDPSQPAEIAPMPDQAMQGPGALGTPDNPMVATIAASPKPPLEIVSKTKTPTESAREKSAVTQNVVAEGAVLNAMEAQGDIDQADAAVKEQLAVDKIEALKADKIRRAEAQAEIDRRIQQRSLREKELVTKRANAQIAAGRARPDFYKGNLTGALISAIVKSVAAGLHAMDGKSGMSPAERVFEEAYANHEKALIAEYEATKQAKDDFDNDRPTFDANINAIRVQVANELDHDIKLALAGADRALAKLEPAKRQQALELKMSVERRADARAELERTKGLRGLSEYESTRRPMGDGSQPEGGENPILDPYTGKVIAGLPKSRMVEGRQSRDSHAALVALREWNSKFKDFLKKNGPVMSKWTPDARNQLTTFATEGAGLLTIANQTGVLNQGEYDRYVAQMTPDGILGLFTSEAGLNRGLDEIVKGAERKQVGKVKTLVPGYVPPKEAGPAPSPKREEVLKKVGGEGKRFKDANGDVWQIKDGKRVRVPQ